VTIGQSFDESVAYYDEWVKQALPSYDEIFSIATALIPFPTDALLDVLDLGAGTGLFSHHVLELYPRARFVLYDVASRMLEVARHRFQGCLGQFEFVVDDYRNLGNLGKFDVVISSLSIHHLPDSEKQDLFSRVYVALRDNGIFINVDQIKGSTPYLEQLYWTNWLKMVRRRGAAEDKIRDSIQRRTAYDQDALLTDQLFWLREAGFADVDCVYKNYFVGVFLAMKR
jgi:tRNA (cmo5U34)-methyltransferase